MLMHYHTCPACAETIGGTEADTRAHLAHQIGGTVDPDPEQWRIICHCGQPMAVQWVNECDDCKEEYEPNGDGYNGLCPHCADGADTIIPLSAEQCERIEAICDESAAKPFVLQTPMGDFPMMPVPDGYVPPVRSGLPEISFVALSDAEDRLLSLETQRARETATILAALRFYQHYLRRKGNVPTDSIADDGGLLVALSVAEIDALCERLNQ